MVQLRSPQVVRVRFAPSPTGIPHIGGMRTALFAYLFARHNNGEFILRIEDTDRKRLVKGSEEAIEESLKWLGLFPDKKFKQSERLSIYKEHSKKLIDEKKAYEKEGALYIHVPDDREFSWVDVIGNKNISFKGSDVEDFVILKSDGFPTYHFASVVDDHLMEISHVMRGEEWISSTPKHLYLYELFNWKPPQFAHLPVILGSDHTKLSKRHGAKSALEYKKEGFLKEAVLNFIALLGWSPGGSEEIMSLDEMVSKFKLEEINVSNPIFDQKKLEWMNGVYIRSKTIDKLSSELKSSSYHLQSKFMRENSDLFNNEENFKKIVKLAQTRITTLVDFYRLTDGMFFSKIKTRLNKAEISVLKDLHSGLDKITEWNQENIFRVLKEVMLKQKIKMSLIYKLLTGSESGLPLPQSLEILGKEKTLEKLE